MILLLNYLGKILEKVMALKLVYLANIKGLLNNIQMGGRKQHSAVDTVILLLHYIQ